MSDKKLMALELGPYLKILRVVSIQSTLSLLTHRENQFQMLTKFND